MTTLNIFANQLFDFPFLRAGADVSSVTTRRPAIQSPAESMAFTHALVALVAKLVVVDGAPNKAEFQAFSALFADADRLDAPRLRSLFMNLVGDGASALQFARQLMAMTPGEQTLHEELLQKLMMIASSDAALNDAEIDLLRSVGTIFGITGAAFDSLLNLHRVPQQQSPYAVLGLSQNATTDEVRERYLARVQLLHPDRHQAAGAGSDAVAQLSGQLAAVNAAYDEIKRIQLKKPSAQAQVKSWWRRNTKGTNAG